MSEYRKRRDYWLMIKNLDQRTSEGPGGVTIEKTGMDLETDAVIIE